MALTTADGGKVKGAVHNIRRLSHLQAPIVSLTGGHSVRYPLPFSLSRVGIRRLLLADHLFNAYWVLPPPLAEQSEILDCKFSPDGQYVAAAGGDRIICMSRSLGMTSEDLY